MRLEEVTKSNPFPTKVGFQAYAIAGDPSMPAPLTLAAGATAPAVVNIDGGSYMVSCQFTGAGPLTLQSLQPDGNTWIDFGTFTSNSPQIIAVGHLAALRVKNGTGAAISGIFFILSGTFAASGGSGGGSGQTDGLTNTQLRASPLGTTPVASSNPIVSYQQTVSTSAAQLATQAFPGGCTIRALMTNSGVVYYGGSDVTTGKGTPIHPGESVALPINNSNLVYVVGDTAGDKVAVSGN